LHPRVRSGASASHYASTGKLPMVPGVDGVGRRENGQLVLAELPPLIDEIDNGGIAVTARPVPLADVETAWTAPQVPGVRTVLVP
jgi:hypothetical protein